MVNASPDFSSPPNIRCHNPWWARLLSSHPWWSCNHYGWSGQAEDVFHQQARLKYATSPNSQIFTFTFLHCLKSRIEPVTKDLVKMAWTCNSKYNFHCNIRSICGYISSRCAITVSTILFCAQICFCWRTLNPWGEWLFWPCCIDISRGILFGRFSSIDAKSCGSSSLLCLANCP